MNLMLVLLLCAVCSCLAQEKPDPTNRPPKKSWAPYKKPYTKAAGDADWMFRDDAQLATEPCNNFPTEPCNNSAQQKDPDAFSSRMGLAADGDDFTLNKENDTNIQTSVSSLPTASPIRLIKRYPDETTSEHTNIDDVDSPMSTEKPSTKKKFFPETKLKKKLSKDKFAKTKNTKGWLKDKMMPPPTENPTTTVLAEVPAKPSMSPPIFKKNADDTVEIKLPPNAKAPSIKCGDEQPLKENASYSTRVNCRLLHVLELHDDITVSATMQDCHSPVDVQIRMKSTNDSGKLDWNFTFVPQNQNERLLLPKLHLAILPHTANQPVFLFVKEPIEELEARQKNPKPVQNITIQLSMWSPFGDRAEEEQFLSHTFLVDPSRCTVSSKITLQNSTWIIALVLGLVGVAACVVGVYMKVVKRGNVQQDNLNLVQNIHTQPNDQEQTVNEATSPPEVPHIPKHSTETSLNNYTPRPTSYAISPPPIYTATSPDYNQNEDASPNRTQMILRNEISDPVIPSFTQTRLDFGSSEWLENLERNSSIGSQIENIDDNQEINVQNIDQKTSINIRSEDQTRLDIPDHDLGPNTEVV